MVFRVYRDAVAVSCLGQLGFVFGKWLTVSFTLQGVVACYALGLASQVSTARIGRIVNNELGNFCLEFGLAAVSETAATPICRRPRGTLLTSVFPFA